MRVVLNSPGTRQVSGRLAQNGVDTYIVSARAGERLSVRLELFPGRALAIRVDNQTSKQTLKGSASEVRELWHTRIPEDGRYVVQIQRRLPHCDPDVTYLATFALQ